MIVLDFARTIFFERVKRVEKRKTIKKYKEVGREEELKFDVFGNSWIDAF